MKPLVLLSLLLPLLSHAVAAEQTYGSGYEPKPPIPFPSAYKDYQILPETFSPDKQFAFIYPKRSLLYTTMNCSLFLAALNPFHVLSRVPTGYTNLAENARGYYAARWSKDSATAVFVAGSRWGPEKVWALQVRGGKVAKQIDLTAEVRRQVLPDFKKSHAPRYNEYYDFVFEDENDEGWKPDGKGHVMIDTTCTTDPKELEAHRWAVRFKGTWDIEGSKFLQKEFRRIPPTPLK